MQESPFKFLSAFEKEDYRFFFGREEETKALYEMTYDTRLMLIYGASGTGKTSLVQCGLANQFKETRWKDIFIRREQNINHSLQTILEQELEKSGGIALGKPENDVERINLIYKAIFKPLYLIFDQFEELFIINPDEAEQQRFFQFVDDLLKSKVAAKILLVMREEFIAQLSNFEEMIPALFDHRFRVEAMRYTKAEDAIEQTLNKLAAAHQISVSQPTLVAKKILQNLTDGKKKLELTYLQVYLDRLYQEADTIEKETPLFTPELVQKTGDFEDIIGEFLTDQITKMETQLGAGKKSIPIKILGALITDERTKKVINETDLDQLCQQLQISRQDFDWCLQTFENMRILKRYD